VALSPDEKRAFVANIGSGSMTAIDLEKGEFIANVPTGEGAEGITVTPDGRYVWVTNRAADTVSVVDAQSLEIVKTLPSASFPIRARATPDGQWVLVTNARSDEMVAFNAENMEEYQRVKMDIKAEDSEGRLFGDEFGKSSVPIGVLVNPDSDTAYVAHANSDVISVVDLDLFEITGQLRGGKEPDGLGYSVQEVSQ
jgi:YVTN family beta-propeller protein